MQARIARLSRQADWSALDPRGSGGVVGTAHGVMRPDGRWFVSIDTWHPPVFDALLEAVDTDLKGPLFVRADEADDITAWLAAGFTVARREELLALPTDPGVTGLPDGPPPAGLALVAADEVDPALLRTLDDELRQDVPGSAGWCNDPDEFREYTFAEWHFDPSLYLVAVDARLERFAGLVRVWIEPGGPRLGLIAVSRSYRRLGLARSMLGTVFGRLHARGVASVVAEVDVTNAASRSLLAGVGAMRTGGAVELRRP
ncbi:GNAT family N-acetyltransferase [Nakamurella sp. YIM 132087]|uniref:GNAT family N-acetyltransferase n=1 Tax=Nakamurella alba TaxID=2665158 RepID=A0A7K1FPG3_9ACTN|nr:GNAT family N-acetyltransferase [Nakamurella alba]MTD16031.1 GNAT family N-acetyltransferase [Nakamurella alba]